MLDGFAVHEIICNEAGQPVDYRFLAVNPAFERLTGLTAGAVVGRTAREVLPGLESEWVESYGRVALTGQPAHFEQRATSLGKVFEVRAFCPRPGRFACVFVDTTARVEAETRRRESEARQQAMLAALPDLLFRLDRNGVIRSYKANLDDLYTPPELELVGRRQQDLLPPAIATLIEERAAAALTSGALQTFDYVLDVRGRGPRSYEARMVRSGEDEVTTVVRDVTEREEQDRQRRVDLAIQYVRAEILAMGDARDWAQVIAAVDRQLRTVLRFDHCSVALIDPAADRVQLYWVSPDGRVREQERQQIHPALRQVWADQQPLQRYRDVDPRFGADMPPEVQAVVDVPFAAGTLAVNTRDPDGFTGPQIGLLVRFAAVLGEAAQRLADLRQQQRMAHALAESEELHRRLVEVSPTAIFIHVNGIIVFVNPAGLALLGAQQEGDLLGRQVLDFVHPDYRARVTARAQHALRANLPIPLAEEQLVRLDGRVIDAEVTGNSLVYHGQPAIQVIAYDITERRRAGVALAASERRYQLLFERSHDAIFLVDPRTGRYLHANQAATTLTGRSLEEIRQLTTNQLCPRGAQDRLRRLARAAGAMDMEEVEYLRPDGTRRTALLTAVPIDDSVSFGIAHDITARKRIESETLLSLALQRLRSEVLQMSRPDDWGRVVTATGRELAAVFALAGYRVTLLQDPQSNLHRYWVSVAGQVALRVTDRWPAAVREAVNSGQAVQVTAPTVDDLGDGIDAEAGRVITVPFVGGVLEVGQAQADDPGEEGLAVLERVAEVLAQACQRSRDLAEQQRLAAEVERQRLQAVQADRLQALGEMATGVAHELNQPLSGIRAFAEGTLIGLRRQWQLAPDELEHTLSDIIDQVDRITEIVDHMRVFARAQGKPGLFPLEEPIAGAMKLIGAQLRSHGISVRHELAPDLPPCLGWSHQIEQILLNLLSNARDALDHRGKAHRSLDPANAVGWHGQVVISATQVPAGLRLSVADNGGGIPSDIADRVFEPFFTTKPPGEGTGIGLAIVKSIVDRHGGTLTVDNQPGEGVTFVVTLPAGTRGHEGVAAR
jgi:PAS domain S-box-containing protein